VIPERSFILETASHDMLKVYTEVYVLKDLHGHIEVMLI